MKRVTQSSLPLVIPIDYVSAKKSTPSFKKAVPKVKLFIDVCVPKVTIAPTL